MGCDRHNFLSIQGKFLLFYRTIKIKLPTLKIKIWKKCTKNLEILSFYTCAP